MEKITFKAGYGDPSRTIAQKYGDYGKIDKLLSEMRARNTVLENKITDLQARKDSLIASFQHLVGMDKAQTEEQIKQLTNQINLIQEKIENNRTLARQAWYGFHERF